MVRAARKEELDYMHGIPLYDVVDEGECWDNTGKAPTSTKWVDLNKGTEEDPEVRCRFVARGFKKHGEHDRADLFAAMPPLEAKKLLFRQAARQKRVWRRGEWDKTKIMVIDVN